MEGYDSSISCLHTPVTRFKSKQIDDKGNLSPCLSMPPSPFLKKLGFGTGVSVYLVERPPRLGAARSPWAVKKINKTTKPERSELYSRRMKREAAILKNISHKNIVGFRALSKANDGSLCLALEDVEKCLFSMIEDRMEKSLGPFPATHIMKVAADVANGLGYLHNEQKILHGDIKSGNVLVKGNFDTAKLCDFGVAIKLDENLRAKSSLYVGTETWSAKEALTGEYVSDRSDMFSYGMVIYEMLTLNLPHFDVFPEEDDYADEEEFENAFSEAERKYQSMLGQALEVPKSSLLGCGIFLTYPIYTGTRPKLPQIAYKDSYRSAIELFFACTEEDSSKRPSARQVSSALSHVDDVTCKLDFDHLE